MTGMRSVRRRTWLVAGLAAVLVIAASVTWYGVARSAEREDRLADNRRQLARACEGLLPDELGALVPDDERGVLNEFGTMLRPREESRALLDCTLSWGGGGDAWEPDAMARVRAEAVLTRTDPIAVDGGFGLPLPESALGSVSTESRMRGSEVTARLLADCPEGLRGRVRPARDLLVTVALPSAADEYDVPRADSLLASRTAVRVADWVARKQGCGGEPLGAKGAAGSAPAKAPKLCDWLDPKALPAFASGTWKPGGKADGASGYSPRTGSCDRHWDDTIGSPGAFEIKGAEAESWSGVLAAGAYDHYEDSGDVPASGDVPDSGDGSESDAPAPDAPDPDNPDPEGPLTVEESGDDPALALWARAECDAGPTYHRVAVTPELTYRDGLDEGKAVLEPEDRRRLSRQARAVLDRYLAAPDGWPRRAHCRSTKIMGEVAEWRG
ncbi:hypothetical protein [Streptomyces sp. DSM 118878]